MEQDKIIKHIAKLVKKEVAYFNGWYVSHETMEEDCKKAAENIFRYLQRGRHLTPVEADAKDLCNKEKCIGYTQIGKNACIRCNRTA